MVVLGVPGTRKFLFLIIPSCLHILAAWEPHGGAGHPGNLQVLVSHHNLLLSPFL